MIGQWEKLFTPSTSPFPPRDDRLEPRAIDNNKAPLPPMNDSARGEFDCQFVADVSPTQEVKL
jgi:hypothetical protein